MTGCCGYKTWEGLPAAQDGREGFTPLAGSDLPAPAPALPVFSALAFARRPRLWSFDHRTDALRVERLAALVAVAGLLQPVAYLSEAKTLSGFGACPP